MEMELERKRERDERYEAKPTGRDQLVVAAWKVPSLASGTSPLGRGGSFFGVWVSRTPLSG